MNDQQFLVLLQLLPAVPAVPAVPKVPKVPAVQVIECMFSSLPRWPLLTETSHIHSMIMLLGPHPGGHGTSSWVYSFWLFFLLVMLRCPPPQTLFFKLCNPTKHLVDAPLVCLLLLSSSVSRMRLRQLSDLKWSTAVLPQSYTDTLAHKHKGAGCVRAPAKRPVLTLILDYALASCRTFSFFLSFFLPPPHSSP